MSGCGLSATPTGPGVTTFKHDGGLIIMTNPKPMPSNSAMKNKQDGLPEHAPNTNLVTSRANLCGVSTVSEAFPGAETGLSAYLSGKRLAVSAFPVFPGFSGGCIDG
jgi:hypothetical protein